MDVKEQLKKYYSQQALEGLLRSAIFGISSGFLVGFIVFVIGGFTDNNLLLAGIITIIGVAIVATGLFYIVLFKPNMKTVARNVDVLGFEERTITMIELEKEDSYIAELQRKNTGEVLSKYTLKLFDFSKLIKPLIILLVVMIVTGSSIGFMMTQVNAANDNTDQIDDPVETEEDFQEMIDELLTIINNSQVDITLKNTLYGMVVDLEERLGTYDTYLEKYTDVLHTRNEILQLIEDAIIEEEDKLENIAEELQKYENTEILGDALLTWDDDVIIEAFDHMYDRIDDLLGQELYDDMLQTAIDIETALEDAVGTDEAMHDALQSLADAYRLALEDFQPGEEQDMLDDFETDMDASLDELLDAVQALREMVEELLELQEDLEEEFDQEEEFPLFMPFPEDSSEGDEDGNPDTTSENTVIDGETPYENIYDTYYADAMNWLTGETVDEELRQIIEDYFDMLK